MGGNSIPEIGNGCAPLFLRCVDHILVIGLLLHSETGLVGGPG